MTYEQVFSQLKQALASWQLWLTLAWLDIRLRYRRSKIGPLWITLSMANFCFWLGVVNSQLFNSNIGEYLPFMAVGFVFWGLISGLINESPTMFVESGTYIKDMKINLFTVLFRLVSRHVIIFFHNFLIIIGVYLYFHLSPNLAALVLLPGLTLVLLNLFFLAVILAIVGARYRDVPPIIQSITQLLFFVTPLTWFPRLLTKYTWVIDLNPFAYYLDLLRSPVLGQSPHISSWLAASLTLLLLAPLAMWLFKQDAQKVAFWI